MSSGEYIKVKTYQGNNIQQKINKLTEFHQWELEVI